MLRRPRPPLRRRRPRLPSTDNQLAGWLAGCLAACLVACLADRVAGCLAGCLGVCLAVCLAVRLASCLDMQVNLNVVPDHRTATAAELKAWQKAWGKQQFKEKTEVRGLACVTQTPTAHAPAGALCD